MSRACESTLNRAKRECRNERGRSVGSRTYRCRSYPVVAEEQRVLVGGNAALVHEPIAAVGPASEPLRNAAVTRVQYLDEGVAVLIGEQVDTAGARSDSDSSVAQLPIQIETRADFEAR